MPLPCAAHRCATSRAHPLAAGPACAVLLLQPGRQEKPLFLQCVSVGPDERQVALQDDGILRWNASHAGRGSEASRARAAASGQLQALRLQLRDFGSDNSACWATPRGLLAASPYLTRQLRGSRRGHSRFSVAIEGPVPILSMLFVYTITAMRRKQV